MRGVRRVLLIGLALAAAVLVGALVLAGGGDDDPPVRAAPRELRLARAPYLGVSCRQPNSIVCDRVRLAVWLRAPVRRLSATIDGRSFRLRPPPQRDGYWEGPLRPAALLTPGSALHVIPDRGPDHWVGRHPVRTRVRLSAVEADGARPAPTSPSTSTRATAEIRLDRWVDRS